MAYIYIVVSISPRCESRPRFRSEWMGMAVFKDGAGGNLLDVAD